MTSRRPARVYGVGQDPDPRFSLANERTALAWLRTGLALVAGAVALTSVVLASHLPRWTLLLAVLAGAGGGVVAFRAVQGWARNERALRLRQPLPAPLAIGLVGLTVGVLAAAAAVLAATELLRG